MSEPSPRIQYAFYQATPLAAALHCALIPAALLAAPFAAAAAATPQAYQIAATDLDSEIGRAHV